MVNNENIIPKTETIYELKEKCEIPSFEEFMKTYERDERVNYDDLSGGGISEVKGYGPCLTSGGCPYSTSLQVKISTRGGLWWGRRRSASGTDPFPASDWKWNSDNSYLYTSILKLDSISQAENAISWIDQGALYTVNVFGIIDNHEREIKNKLREAIEKHERGESVSMDYDLFPSGPRWGLNTW